MQAKLKLNKGIPFAIPIFWTPLTSGINRMKRYKTLRSLHQDKTTIIITPKKPTKANSEETA